MGKKAAGVKMSLADVGARFGVDNSKNLPTHSESKDREKGAGKGNRDFDGSREEMSDWGRGGTKGGGKGMFGGNRREGGGRAEEADNWRSGGGGGGGGGGGDEGGKGGRGLGRTDRRGDQDTQAEKDDDWRGGGGGGGKRDDDRGFGRSGSFRDRDGPRGGGGEPPRERQRLQLKPRSSPLPDGSAPPAARADEDRAAADEDDDGFEKIKSGAKAGKYEPPARREAAKTTSAFSPIDEDDDWAAPKKSAAPATKYVPPGQKKAEEERRKAQEAKENEKRAKEEMERRKEEEEIAKEEKKLAEERAKKKAAKDAKEADKQAEKEAFEAKRNQKKLRAVDVIPENCKKEILAAWEKKCEAVTAEAKPDIKKLVKEVDALGQDEKDTLFPMRYLAQPLLQKCRGKEDEEVVDLVKMFAPVMNALLKATEVHRFKIKVLCDIQRLAHEMGLPRLSAESAVLEVFFDGLYQAEVIEEAYFLMWADSDKPEILDVPGRINAMFQLQPFLDWLRNPNAFDSDDEEGEEEEDGENEDEEDDEEELSDIEANVPKRGAAPRVRP